MRVLGLDQWHVCCHPWQFLQYKFNREFLPTQRSGSSTPGQDALAFILFAERQREADFPGLQVWWLCRNFEEAFPESDLVRNVQELKHRLESGFERVGKRIVLHGRIAQLEPAAAERRPTGGMTPVGGTGVWIALAREPSNWGCHRDLVHFYGHHFAPAQIAKYVDYPAFPQQSMLYPGNEWVYLGNAAYKLRVRKQPKAAVEFADKALILNPENAKALAIRGMIRVVAGEAEGLAFEDLMRAYALEPASIGDEPETPPAALLVLEKVLEMKDAAGARTYFDRLGELKAFKAETPVKEMAEYQALMKQLDAK